MNSVYLPTLRDYKTAIDNTIELRNEHNACKLVDELISVGFIKNIETHKIYTGIERLIIYKNI